MRPMYTSLAIVLVVAMATIVMADDKSPLVKVRTPTGSGTGTVIKILKNKPTSGGYEGYILTAYHVVDDSAENGARNIKIEYENGLVALNCQVVASDIDADISIIWTWVPKNVEAIELASRKAQYGDKLVFNGLGGGIDITVENDIRHIDGEASAPTNKRRLYSDTVLIPGDSGGPVTVNDKLVGVISGGWFWYRLKADQNKFDKNGKIKIGQRVTWPAQACNLDPIKELIKQLDVGKPGPQG